MPKHTCKFEEIAESRQATHYWCKVCGAYKRVPNGDWPDDTDTITEYPTGVKR